MGMQPITVPVMNKCNGDRYGVVQCEQTLTFRFEVRSVCVPLPVINDDTCLDDSLPAERDGDTDDVCAALPVVLSGGGLLPSPGDLLLLLPVRRALTGGLLWSRDGSTTGLWVRT